MTYVSNSTPLNSLIYNVHPWVSVLKWEMCIFPHVITASACLRTHYSCIIRWYDMSTSVQGHSVVTVWCLTGWHPCDFNVISQWWHHCVRCAWHHCDAVMASCVDWVMTEAVTQHAELQLQLTGRGELRYYPILEASFVPITIYLLITTIGVRFSP